MSQEPIRPSEAGPRPAAVAIRKVAYVEDATGRRGWVHDRAGPSGKRLKEAWMVEVSREGEQAREVRGTYAEARSVAEAASGMRFPASPDDWCYDLATGRMRSPS